MSPLKFKALSGVTYQVFRCDVLLGQVDRVELKTTAMTSRSNGSATGRISTIVRWRFQAFGQKACPSLYMTRQRAAESLASQYDAHQWAKAVTP